MGTIVKTTTKGKFDKTVKEDSSIFSKS